MVSSIFYLLTTLKTIYLIGSNPDPDFKKSCAASDQEYNDKQNKCLKAQYEAISTEIDLLRIELRNLRFASTEWNDEKIKKLQDIIEEAERRRHNFTREKLILSDQRIGT